MDYVEREIRNAVVDILCFLSSGKATAAQMVEIEKGMSKAMDVIRESCEKENVGT